MSTFQIELFSPAIGHAKQLIETQLDRYTQFDSQCPTNLREAIRYSLLAPGKRLRPLLVVTAAQVCGGSILDALPAACAVEMIHAYSLIHDDLPAMDNDDLRRGLPTCHIKFGEATAILAGDALIPLAFEVLARDSKSPAIAALSCAVLAQAAGARELVGGQADDLAHQFSAGNLELLQQIHHRKTAALLAASLKLGGISASASTETLGRLENFGRKLGLAFQITDDLLDFRGDQDKMGKRVQKDQNLGKLTYPSLLGAAESQQRAERLIEEAQSLLAPLGDSARPLHDLAAYVVQRTH
jgi:geranylgeranyl diphosphate synthase type II